MALSFNSNLNVERTNIFLRIMQKNQSFKESLKLLSRTVKLGIEKMKENGEISGDQA